MNQKDYNRILGIDSTDIGSVFSLRIEVNKLLAEKGYAKLRGYKTARELWAIRKKILSTESK